MKWCVSLDSVCAKSANSTNIGHFYDLLHHTLTKNNISTHIIWNFDKTGCPIGGSKKGKVVGATETTYQTQQQDASKENMTVMCCVCADGTNVSPVVIFKGQYFLKKWLRRIQFKLCE